MFTTGVNKTKTKTVNFFNKLNRSIPSIYLLFFILTRSFTVTYGQTCTSGGNQNTYGTSSWIGYVYDHNGSGNPISNPFETYKGYVTETENFNRNWGNGNPSCAAGGNNFAIRYRLNKTFDSGNYTFTIGADDGVRFSIDGGVTWVLNRWVDAGYGTTEFRIPLAGNYNLVLEYYEKSGSAQVSFNYTVETTTDLRMPSTNVNSFVRTCGGRIYDSGGSSANYGDNENRSVTFYPVNACDKVSLNLASFTTESSSTCDDVDILSVYNGSAIYSPNLLRRFQSGCSTSAATGTVTSTAPDGSLTVHFKSNGSNTAAGWNAAISCITPTAAVSMTACPSNRTVDANTTTCLGKSTWTTPTVSNLCIPKMDGMNYVGNLNGNVYYYVPVNLSWTAAKADAEAKGGRLVVIETAAENTFLANYLTAFNIPVAWTGFSDVAVEGNFVSITGVPLSYGNVGNMQVYDVYNNWLAGEPNDTGGDEDFGSIQPSGGWNDLATFHTNGYFIEYGVFQMSGFENGASNFPLGNTTVTYQVIAPNTTPISCSFVVTVNGFATASLTTSNMNACHGSSVSLGGNVSATGPWTITLSDGTTVTGTGTQAWNKLVSPTATSTYSISTFSAFCPRSNTGSTTVTLPTKSSVLATHTQSATCYVSGNNPIHFYQPTTGNYIGSINPNGRTGTLTMTAYVDVAGVVDACNLPGFTSFQTAYMGRRFTVIPTGSISSTGNLSVYFPFTESELADLTLKSTTGTPNNPNDNVNSISDLFMSKFSNSSEDGNPANNCGSTASVLPLITRGDISSAFTLSPTITAKFGQVSVASFSEFYFQGKNTFGGSNSPLPVTLTQFNATCDDVVQLTWTTASEQNSDQFIVESSTDLATWNFVSEVLSAGNSTTNIDYTATDVNRRSGISYYRLVQLDLDGKEKIYGPISVDCDALTERLNVFPNPSNGHFTVHLTSNQVDNEASILLMDLTGKVIEARNINVLQGSNQYLFDATGYESGTYMIRYASKVHKYNPVKVVVTN